MEAVQKPHGRRQHERRHPEVDVLIRDTHAFLERNGIERSASWVSRTVRSYTRGPRLLDFTYWLTAQLDLNVDRRHVPQTELVVVRQRNVFGVLDETGATAALRLDRADWAETARQREAKRGDR